MLAEHDFTIQKLKRRQYIISDIQKSPKVDFRKVTNKKRNQILSQNPPVNLKISKPQKIIPQIDSRMSEINRSMMNQVKIKDVNSPISKSKGQRKTPSSRMQASSNQFQGLQNKHVF